MGGGRVEECSHGRFDVPLVSLVQPGLSKESLILVTVAKLLYLKKNKEQILNFQHWNWPCLVCTNWNLI